MTQLFRNRWRRIYFQLLDAFDQSRCPLCFLMERREAESASALLRAGQEAPSLLNALCVLHRSRLKMAIADGAQLLSLVKIIISDFVARLGRPPRPAPPRWRPWSRRSSAQCSWCRQLSADEGFFCRALIRFLNDTSFWKGFQRAPLLCAAHLKKCLSLAPDGKGSQRLIEDQRAKLGELLGEVIRWEATGAHEECRRSALDWLVDFPGLSPEISVGGVFAAVPDIPPELVPGAPSEPSSNGVQDPEALLFEKEKLERMVSGLVARLSELESRAASLQYQVARLSDENKRLEMGYIGANTQARGLEDLVRDLRAEIKQLRGRDAANGRSPAS